MVRFKSQLKMFDVMVGMFYAQFRFPSLFIWIFILGMNFYHQCLPHILAGKVLFGWVLFLIYVLRLTAVILLGSIFFIIAGKYMGGLKDHFLIQEYTLEGNTILDKAGEKESKSYLEDIQFVYEDKKRFMLFKSGFKFEVISKLLLTETELGQIRDFFASKSHAFVTTAFKSLPYVLLILAAVTAYGVFVPNYSKISTVGNMAAFYQDDELVVSISVQSQGNQDDLYDGIFPPNNRKVAQREPFIETHFYDIKNGTLTQLTLTGHEYSRIYPYGQEILCAAMDGKDRKLTKFDGKQFVPVTPEEKDAMTNKPEPPGPPAWKMFRLWDESGKELEDRDSLKGEDNWATFPLKSGPVQVHYRSDLPDPKTYSTRHYYSVKGLTPNGGEQDLLSVTDGINLIDQKTYEDDFPVKADVGQEGAQ